MGSTPPLRETAIARSYVDTTFFNAPSLVARPSSWPTDWPSRPVCARWRTDSSPRRRGRTSLLGQREARLMQLRALDEQAGPQATCDSASNLARARSEPAAAAPCTSARRERAAQCGSSSMNADVGRAAQDRVRELRAGSMTCSQLSRISISLRDFRCAHSVCISGRLASSRTPSTRAVSLGDQRTRSRIVCKIDEPDAVGIGVHDARADLQREPRLAEAAHAEQRQETRRRRACRSISSPLALASDERCGGAAGAFASRRSGRPLCGGVGGSADGRTITPSNLGERVAPRQPACIRQQPGVTRLVASPLSWTKVRIREIRLAASVDCAI